MSLFAKKHTEPTPRQRLRRENSNLTSRPVNQTFSYRSSRSDAIFNTGRQLHREAIQKSAKGLRYGLQRFGVIILLLTVIISALNIISLSPAPKIQVLAADDNVSTLRPQQEYEAYASQLLKGSIWNNNKITLNTADINQKMLDRFAELDSVSVTVPLLARRPIIYVQPSRPAVILNAANGAFMVSDSGKALLRGDTPQDLHQDKLPVVTDQSGLKLQLSHQALPAASVKFIQGVIAQLAAKQYTVSTMTLPAGSSELDVQLVGQAYTVKFNLHASDKARQQAGTFLATIGYLHTKNQMPAKYIDVRVDGRAYYQ